MEMTERMELKKKYSSLPDETISEMLLEGRDSYVAEAYELLLSEAKQRGIESRLEESEKPKENVIMDEKYADEAKTEVPTFIQIMIVNDNDDVKSVTNLFEGADESYYFQDLSLKGEALPVSLMVAEPFLDKAKGLLADFKPNNSIILW